MAYFIFFVSLLFTIVTHEFGHMTLALLCKVNVEAFSVGFWKPRFHKTWKGIDWRITPWLVGGYCKITGETTEEYNGLLLQPYYKKCLILLAGVFFNLIVALVCYLINYQNIFLGLYIDWIAVQSVFTNNYDELVNLIVYFKPNLFLLQLGLINITCAVLNLVPWPCTDGSFLFLYAMKPIWKEKFVSRLQFLVKWGFISINVLQGIFIIWMFIK